MLTSPFSLPVFVTAVIQYLLWRDKRKAARGEFEGSWSASRENDSPPLQASNIDEKKAVRTEEITLGNLN
jgi:MFS transporter, ACS family, pantothenate transporter